MTRSSAIEIRGLEKRYGNASALAGVDLTVEEGSVFGFLGPNGAGKTTTLRIVTALARPTAGDVRIFGEAPGAAVTRARIGYLPDVPGFYPWMTAEEFLRFAGGLFGLRGAVLDERVTGLLDLAGLAGVTTRVGGFSRGMKQRLGVAQALINAPRLLLLDEPTSALDPLGRKEVLDMVASLRGRTTVFFSTHILGDVERVCDTVAILDRGRVVTQSSIDDLKARYGSRRLVLEVEGEAASLAESLVALPFVDKVELGAEGEISLAVNDLSAAQRGVVAFLADHGAALKRFESGEVGLEEVFVSLVGGRER